MIRENRNPEGYRVRRGKYWLKEKLDKCTMPEICPDCEDYFLCLQEYCDRAYEGTL
jgi:hypothetical protein